MMATKAKEVSLSDGKLSLLPADFAALRLFADDAHEVIHHERPFARLQALGMVKHRFTDEGWPRALAVLTPRGREALRLDPLYAASQQP